METYIIHAQNVREIQKRAETSVIALGYFDGVHLGHQAVICTAKNEATKRGLPLVVMSFLPHPINVLSNGKRFVPQLITITEKEQLLQQLGVDFLYLVEFTMEFASLTPKEFVKDYLVKLKVVHAVAGFDFSYGAKGCAHLPQIYDDSDGKITCTEVGCVDYLGEKISSTAIRKRLLTGEVHEIPYLLGKHYSVKAYWDQRRLVLLEGAMLPKEGLYDVVIEQQGKSIYTTLTVSENSELCNFDLSKQLVLGNVKVTWLNNQDIYQDNFVEKNLIV